MDTLIKIVESLGLDEKQTKVYLAALELGSASVAELSEKSGVKRTSIYNFLEELISKGLLSELRQRNNVLLIAEDPKNLIDKAKTQLHDVERIMPELLAMFNRPGNKPKVHFYQGIAGFKRIYEDTLTENQPIYAFSDFEKMMPIMEDYLWNYVKRRVEAKIPFKTIAKESDWTHRVMSKDKVQNRQTKITKDVSFATEINIYGNKVSLMSFQKPYASVMIEDVAIAQTLKSIWTLLWNKL
jgi:sugar-specific transcriptional regulator TrmB